MIVVGATVTAGVSVNDCVFAAGSVSGIFASELGLRFGSVYLIATDSGAFSERGSASTCARAEIWTNIGADALETNAALVAATDDGLM